MALYNEMLNVPTLGASGAVFGILLAFGMTFPNQYIYVYFLLPIKAKWFVIIYGALELYNGIMYTNDGIAHFAHLGGMLFGFFLIRYWRKNQFRQW
jgi:membrane associated rhomboid family serine protease